MNSQYHLITFNGDWAVITDAAGKMLHQGHHDDIRQQMLELLGIEDDYRGDADDHPQFGVEMKLPNHIIGRRLVEGKTVRRSIFQPDAKFEVWP